MEQDRSLAKPGGKLVFLIAVLALAVGLVNLFKTPPQAQVGLTAVTIPGLLQRIEATGAIQAGYGVYPPYTQEDPNTHKVSGFSVDLMEWIAKEINVKVVWHRLNWNIMAADLRRGRFDVIADPIFQTIPRAREFAFTIPYAFFPVEFRGHHTNSGGIPGTPY